MPVHIKRVYEPSGESDGKRILVDRLWPRGLAKAEAHIDLWMKDVAPSAALRRWFGHDPARWTEFQRRYLEELAGNPQAVDALRKAIGQSTATLLYGARDEAHNQAVVLQAFIAGK